MPRTFRLLMDIEKTLTDHEKNDFEALELAQVEEMMVMGCLCCPREKTLLQRRTYFSDIDHRNLAQLLQYAQGADFV